MLSASLNKIFPSFLHLFTNYTGAWTEKKVSGGGGGWGVGGGGRGLGDKLS